MRWYDNHDRHDWWYMYFIWKLTLNEACLLCMVAMHTGYPGSSPRRRTAQDDIDDMWNWKKPMFNHQKRRSHGFSLFDDDDDDYESDYHGKINCAKIYWPSLSFSQNHCPFKTLFHTSPCPCVESGSFLTISHVLYRQSLPLPPPNSSKLKKGDFCPRDSRPMVLLCAYW